MVRATSNRSATARSRRAWGAGLVLLPLVLALLGGPLAGVASAHADVVKVSPAPAEVLERSPKTVQIWFTEGVDLSLGGVFVYDDQGNRVAGQDLHQPTPDHLVLRIPETLPDGTYIVTYRATSEDSHPVQGTWTFSVGAPSSTSAAVQQVASDLVQGQKADRSVAVGWGIARWAAFASLALLVGGAAFGSVIWPRSRDRRAARRIVTAGWAGLTVSTIVGVLLFGAYSRGGDLADALDPGILRDTLDTRFGHVWLARLAVLVVAFVVLRVLFERRPAATTRLPEWWLPVAAVVGVALVATPGLAGHASTGDHRALSLVTDTLHVAAMAIWLGGLVVLAAVVLRDDDPDEIREASHRFSRVAFGCVAVLVVTGAFQTWRVVGGFDALRNDEYGRILVVKLVVFALLLVVASFSREITERALGRPSGEPPDATHATDPPDGSVRTRELPRLHRAVWAEVGLGALVLVVTAMLVNSAPPADATASSSAASVTIQRRAVTLDVSVTPGIAGLNDVHVSTTSPTGAPLAVSTVEMTMAYPARRIAPLTVPLRQLGPGNYLSPGLDIPLAGTWRVQATIRLGPVDRVDVTGKLEIR